MLAASIDDEQVRLLFSTSPETGSMIDQLQSEAELSEPKTNAKMVIRRLNKNSEPQATIEAGNFTIQYVVPY